MTTCLRCSQRWEPTPVVNMIDTSIDLTASDCRFSTSAPRQCNDLQLKLLHLYFLVLRSEKWATMWPAFKKTHAHWCHSTRRKQAWITPSKQNISCEAVVQFQDLLQFRARGRPKDIKFFFNRAHFTLSFYFYCICKGEIHFLSVSKSVRMCFAAIFLWTCWGTVLCTRTAGITSSNAPSRNRCSDIRSQIGAVSFGEYRQWKSALLSWFAW